MKNGGFEFDITFDAGQDTRFLLHHELHRVRLSPTSSLISAFNSEFVGNDYYDVKHIPRTPYPNIPLQRIEEGRSIGSFYMFQVRRHNDRRRMADLRQGRRHHQGHSGHRSRSRQYVGNGLPKFTPFSTNHVFRYKNFDLSLFFPRCIRVPYIQYPCGFYYGTRNFSRNMLRKAYGKNSLWRRPGTR